MLLSKECIELLIDLVEIRMDNLIISDRDDANESSRLRVCKQELSKYQKYGSQTFRRTRYAAATAQRAVRVQSRSR